MQREPERTDFATTIPKAEIHLHLEGSIDIETLISILGRHGEPIGSATRRRLAELYRHRDFPNFLEHYRSICSELEGPHDLALATTGLCTRLAAENVRYAEVFCSPMIFTRRGIPLGEIMDAISEASRRSEVAGGPKVRFLFDGVRQWGAGAQEELVQMAATSRRFGVIGIGLGGDERSAPASDFAAAYREARRLGLHTTIHAGEFDGPRSVWDSIETLEVERVGHGIRAVEDPDLLRTLACREVPLECCPTSNLGTGIVASWESHPIRALHGAGVTVTVNSDDPALFGSTITNEWRVLETRLGLQRGEAFAIGQNTVRASFLDPDEKQALLDAMARAAVPFGVVA